MLKTESVLEFDKIKEILKCYACTDLAKGKIDKLELLMSQSEVLTAQRETSEARLMIEKCGNPPLSAMIGIDKIIASTSRGDCLSGESLEQIGQILSAVRRIKDYLRRGKRYNISLPYFEENLDSLDDIRDEISDKIRGGRVDDTASALLRDIRRDIENIDMKMRAKADMVMKANKECLSDSYSTIRNGRICIPVKTECRNKIKGTVIDKSATGSTLFIQPEVVAKYFDDLTYLRLDEENEEFRILYTISAMLFDKAEVFKANTEVMGRLDFIFSKAKLAVDFDCVEPKINTERMIVIENGRHMLMDKAKNVPLDFKIGNGNRGIIITGPNTGGKTVAIKTVALNCMMAQCGLHVPCKYANISMNDVILCDIGDGQNISESLSTFSAHITNTLDILRRANRESLVIMDELGSGTDPTEGMGIAIAILEELRKSGCLYLATTHYPEVKNYAEERDGIINARMAFDRESLKPLYKLEIGKAGESCAFDIAKRLGMPDFMLKRATQASYGEAEAERQFEGIDINNKLEHIKTTYVKEIKKPKKTAALMEKFKRGDSVMMYPDKTLGIVCHGVNEKGHLCIQLKNEKIWVNHKRVKLVVSANKLYPEDYDFSIIFDSVAIRKARHDMNRKFVENEITIEE